MTRGGHKFSPIIGATRRGYYGRPPAYGQGGYGYGIPPTIVDVPMYEVEYDYESDSDYSNRAYVSTDNEEDDDSIFGYD